MCNTFLRASEHLLESEILFHIEITQIDKPWFKWAYRKLVEIPYPLSIFPSPLPFDVLRDVFTWFALFIYMVSSSLATLLLFDHHCSCQYYFDVFHKSPHLNVMLTTTCMLTTNMKHAGSEKERQTVELHTDCAAPCCTVARN